MRLTLVQRPCIAVYKLAFELTSLLLNVTAFVDLTVTSGGAIFHTGSMRVINTSFVANMAGVEGPGLMSIGYLEELSNVSFMANTFLCDVGQYGYINKNEARTIR